MGCITKIVIVCLCLCLTGCEIGVVDYTTTCDIKKVDGKADVVTVTLPHPKDTQSTELSLTNRQEVQKMIDALESLKLDLELVIDQMPFPEPKVNP